MFNYCNFWKVVTNIENQHSIWPATKAVPIGWNEEGMQGSKEECLIYIRRVWTDMRPQSLREIQHYKISDAEAA